MSEIIENNKDIAQTLIELETWAQQSIKITTDKDQICIFIIVFKLIYELLDRGVIYGSEN